MKKRKDPLLKFKGWFPTINQIKNDELRLKKDAQTFFWFVRSPKGRGYIRLLRQILKLPEDGITLSKNSLSSGHHYEDLPEYPKFPRLDAKKLDYQLRQVIHLSGKLNERFYHSLKSFIVFGKAVNPLPPVQPKTVIPKIPADRRLINADKEVWIEVYPGTTFRDFKYAWSQIDVLQQDLEPGSKKQWRVFSQNANPNYKNEDESLPLTERRIYVQIFKNTTLDDLNSPKFRDTLSRLLKTATPQIDTFRRWNYKKALQLFELDADKSLSDWDKAEQMENDEKKRLKIKKLRFRARHKL